MNIRGMKILFLGDSITEGHGASEQSKRFTDLLAQNEGVISYNYGIGGTRIAYQQNPSENPRWDLNFIDRVEKMETEADIIFVFGGTNDFGHGDAPIGCFDDRTPHTFYGALHTLILKLINRYPTAKIVFATPLHRTEEEKRILKGDKLKCVRLIDYVKILREVTEYYGIPVLDLYKNCPIQPQVPLQQEMYMPDGIHPNDAGYRILADCVAAYLKHQFN